MTVDNYTQKILAEVESKLKDRFTHYLVVALDGDSIYDCFDSNIIAIGLADYIIDRIKTERQDE